LARVIVNNYFPEGIDIAYLIGGLCAFLLIRRPGSMKDTQTQQIKLRTAIRLSLDEFQAMDLPLGLSIIDSPG